MTIRTKIVAISTALLVYLGLYFLFLYVGTPFKQHGGDWSNAFTGRVQTKIVEVRFLERINEWNAGVDDFDGRTIVGSGGHWLGFNPHDLPKGKPAQLWYDGRFIAEAETFGDFVLSPNGLHYAYSETENSSTPQQRQTLHIDNKQFVSGTNIRILRLPDDPGQVYLSCRGCDSLVDGFYRGRTLLAAYDIEITEETVDRLSTGECLFNYSINTEALLRKIASIDEDKRLTCSPNGNYITESKNVPRFPIGSKDVVTLNGRRIASGILLNLAINDKGQVSYLNSDGSGGGLLVIHGKEYTFSGYTQGSGADSTDHLYSPSQNHIATVLKDGNYQARWWVDGQPTEALIVDNVYDDGRLINPQLPSSVSLNDNHFYVYKMITR